jgi:regulator of PEP synthase PpsR (kinase-PPPase family)
VGRHYFHLHLVSDSTGETLIATSRAAAAQYEGVSSIEHVYPLVRSRGQLVKAIAEIELAPGIVLFTLVDQELARQLEVACKEIGVPYLPVLQPIMDLFQSYIGTASKHRPGAQHMLNADYFRRIDALNFTMIHDDGQQTENFEAADVVLLGVSRTSKTPTSIYLAPGSGCSLAGSGVSVAQAAGRWASGFPGTHCSDSRESPDFPERQSRFALCRSPSGCR